MQAPSKSYYQSIVTIAMISVFLCLFVSGCSYHSELIMPRIAVTLPERFNTPDGMVLDKETNTILLCCPNLNNDAYSPRLCRITPDDQIEQIYMLPLHPGTDKCCPLGIDIGPDGDLYIADNQGMVGQENQSRLIRVRMDKGRPLEFKILVYGMNQANGVVCHGDSVYVTETSIDSKAYPLPSGVYRFKLSELNSTITHITPGGKDEHLIATLYTHNKDWPIGANGIAFDHDGNMYVCNFGDASIIKFTFDKDGNVNSRKTLVQGQGMESTDGLKYDAKTGYLYVADYVGNAVHRINPRTGRVTTIAKNQKNTDGSGGLLDRPSELCLRNNKIYVANIDLPDAGNKFDPPHTISVITLE
ncbi:MAG: SMP-30/gluconolactonase/LRE family protein [Sedimentisphaerales bacterium]|nr:SMP-30/gluconolactonase/LRE family protein [Sedimentisphaerales bacterium]